VWLGTGLGAWRRTLGMGLGAWLRAWGGSFRWCLGGYCADNLPGDGVRRKLLRRVGDTSSGFTARGEPSANGIADE
jgi:hypothetical protein